MARVYDETTLSQSKADSGAISGPDLLKQKQLSVLAVGDIADCWSDHESNKIWENLKYSFGFASSVTPRNRRQADIAAVIADHPDALFLPLGDLVYEDGSPAEFAGCYDPYFGEFKDRTYPVPGNHDYKSPLANGYFSYWSDRAGYKRHGYYSVRVAGWLLLAVNSEEDVGVGSRQYRWITDQIGTFEGNCVIAYFHSPAYSSKHRNDTDMMRPLFGHLHDMGVSLTLSGHNHFYERMSPLNASGETDHDGVRAFIVGSGGKPTKIGYAGRPSENSARLIMNKAGLLKVELGSDRYAWSFIEAATGNVLDRGISQCRDRKKSKAAYAASVN